MGVPSSLLRVPVEMPDRSGHNMDHSNSFTGLSGSLIPVLCQELLPNDTISLGSAFQVQLPPMVTDFYGRVDFVLEAFFVPNRLLWAGWKDFITHPTANPQYPEGSPVQSKPTEVPYFYISPPTGAEGSPPGVYIITPDSLLHYLDYGKSMNYQQNGQFSVLPAIAYHRIWDDWYRDTRVQAPLFFPSASASSVLNANLVSLPFASTSTSGATRYIQPSEVFADGVSVDSLRQRNWVKDYFTSASPLPQAGGASEVKFDVVDNTGAFSIATLRSANSLQKWMERNNLAGYRYSDQIYAQFGIYPSDAIMDRCLYLGRHVDPVYTRSVFDTTSDNLGQKGANSQVLGEGSLIENFTATEHGYIMVLASLVPRPVYGSGCDRSVFRTKVGDFAFPLLAGMGDQAILSRELTGISTDTGTFGYTDLYADYKFKNDRIHGLLRDGENLDTYALQRGFANAGQQISSDFLKIPTNFLDQVQVVSSSAQGYTYWAQVHFPDKKISTIPSYSQPTLADLKHAHTEYISRGGKRL